MFRLFAGILFLMFSAIFVMGSEDQSNYAAKEDMKEYIKEHLNLTEEAYEANDQSYYLFYMNDLDKDQYLDGHEIRSTLHATQMNLKRRQKEGEEEVDVWALDRLNDWVDHVLKEDDINGDGLISQAEYIASQVYHHQKV